MIKGIREASFRSEIFQAKYIILDNDDVERRQSQKNGRTRKQEPEEDVKFKRPKIQREWDVGKLKSEPFGGNIERPDFAPSGRLAGSSKSRGDDEKEREKPCFEPSGKLAKDTNMYVLLQ